VLCPQRGWNVRHNETRSPMATVSRTMAGPWRSRCMTMLELRPGCECCDTDLPPDSLEARICSYECTFCRDCAERLLGGKCPNCGGELVRRPIRLAERLLRH